MVSCEKIKELLARKRQITVVIHNKRLKLFFLMIPPFNYSEYILMERSLPVCNLYWFPVFSVNLFSMQTYLFDFPEDNL